MNTDKDTLVRMRKLLTRRHMRAIRKIKSLSSRYLAFNQSQDKEEMLRAEGEKAGLCYALKVLDKACQTEMTL
jgi:hypothetical protein